MLFKNEEVVIVYDLFLIDLGAFREVIDDMGFDVFLLFFLVFFILINDV